LDFNYVFIFEFCNRYTWIFEICKLTDRCCEEFEFGNRFGFGFEFEFGILEMDLKFYIRDFFLDFYYILKYIYIHNSGRFGPKTSAT
jgi:hypothetical protein